MSSSNSNKDIISGPEYRSIRMQSAPETAGSVLASLSSPSSSSEPIIMPMMNKQPPKPLHQQRWNLPEQLPTVPDQYILGPSHVYIAKDESSPQVIADRLYNLCASQNIAIQSNDSHQNSLIGEASCGLKVGVNLFAADDNKSTLVEVQRRTGCSYAFHLVACGIIKTAKGLHVEMFHSRNLTMPDCIPQACVEERKRAIEKDTEMALNLVQSPRIDAKLLGLQSLERLSTDEYSASLLRTEETITTLQSFLRNEQQQSCIMKRRALGILANILKYSSNGDEEKTACSGLLKCPNFMEGLLVNLQNSATSPHEALQATKCLQSSVGCLCESKQQALSSTLASLQAPQDSPLEKECEELHQRMMTRQS